MPAHGVAPAAPRSLWPTQTSRRSEQDRIANRGLCSCHLEAQAPACERRLYCKCRKYCKEAAATPRSIHTSIQTQRTWNDVYTSACTDTDPEPDPRHRYGASGGAGMSEWRSVQYALRWRLVGNRWRLVCNRWQLVGNRWRLVGNRWRLVGSRWRFMGREWMP